MYDKRISSVFKKADKLKIDNNSKIVIMSDTHRGEGDLSDNFAKNENIYLAALQYYLREGYTYIELGDGDELWEIKNFERIKNKHIEVFLLLKEFYNKKRLHMLFGNHDIAKRREKWCRDNLAEYKDEYNDKHITLFENCCKISESMILRHEPSQREIFLLHGHQGDFLNDRLWRLARFLVRYLWRPLELLGMHNPGEPADSLSKKDKIEHNLKQWSRRHGRILLAGHTHRPAFPKKGEPLYFNDGCCVKPRNIQAIEIFDGAVSLVKWSVFFRPDRTLYIDKLYIKEPVKLADL